MFDMVFFSPPGPKISSGASYGSRAASAILVLVIGVGGLSLRAESEMDLTRWKIEGPVGMDASKAGPSGAPSIKLEPGSKGTLKLRNEDASGKLTLYVFDDGTVASPDKKRAVGPRWGFTQRDGRIFVGAIMYARFLGDQGSYCLVNTDPAQKGAWNAMSYVAPRGTPGWKKWEFDYDPEAGLKISIDGKTVDARHFNWNLSHATGFDGLVLYGDDTAGGTPQTIWVADVSCDPGGPMKVQPNPAAPAAAASPAAPAAAPVSEAEIAQADQGTPASMTNYIPGPTLADDLKGMRVPLAEGYAAEHPRLLFSEKDRPMLQQRAKDFPALWNLVLDNAKSVQVTGALPAAEVIRTGGKYWLAERIESGALAWFVTGDQEYRDGVVRWMLAHAQEPVWGTLYRPNLDLVASWYLYHLAVGYDTLWNVLTPEERKTIRDSLVLHARAIFADHDPANTKEKIRYDQNHTYIPVVALAAASLALLDEVPEAKVWLKRSYAILRRCRYVQGEDGYYHEGFGYWTYALHWQVRGAELLGRATGEKLFDLPVLRDSWMHGLYLSLPGSPYAFDIGDTGIWKEANRRPDITVTNYSMLWAMAAQNGSGESQAAGNLYQARQAEKDYPASAFLWFDPAVKPAPLDQIKPYCYFPDHDLVAWRSGWGPDATCYLFRCGPPLGHRAADKLAQLKDWTMNCGHVHPDIGAFWMYAKGEYLAVGTGYSTRKWTRDHNTLLVDGSGQGADGAYWNERGVPYQALNGAHIDREYLCDSYGFASGEFGSVYVKDKTGLNLRRSLLMTKRWALVVDDFSGEQPHDLTWLCHADATFVPEGSGFIARLPKASLAVLPLAPEKLASKIEPSVIASGRAPGQETPMQRGFQLELSLPGPSRSARLINLLVPLGPNGKLPEVELEKAEAARVAFAIKWPQGQTEHVDLNLAAGNGVGPAVIAEK